jgi:hypothetical protein
MARNIIDDKMIATTSNPQILHKLQIEVQVEIDMDGEPAWIRR